ncbi:MAG TPA: hypothetical protein VGI70_18675, partial [Polyangiales bacterium]
MDNPVQALEAALRLLATDLKSREHLTQVEDCAAAASGWTRLAPVYDRLLKATEDDAEKVALLTRYADLLDTRAGQTAEALDRIMHASLLAPDDESLIARAEKLAQRSRRGPDLLAFCEHQALQLTAAKSKVEWLLRAARFALSNLHERVRASGYFAAALAATQADPELCELVVRAAVQLDAALDDEEPQPMLRALIQAHRQIAEVTPAPFGPSLILRGSRLIHDRLDDERGAFDFLRQGSSLFPLEESLYDSLFARAEALGRLDALDVHLARAIDEALDPKSAAALLSRRARLLEGPLGRPEDAADVFAKLLQLRPEDTQAAAKLRDSLRRARRFQDLLLVIHKQMQRVKNAEEKLELLKESAQVWELDLKNRWEALDAWRKVFEFAPRDAEARRAIARLDRRSLPPSAAESEEEDRLDAEALAAAPDETTAAEPALGPAPEETTSAEPALASAQRDTAYAEPEFRAPRAEPEPAREALSAAPIASEPIHMVEPASKPETPPELPAAPPPEPTQPIDLEIASLAIAPDSEDIPSAELVPIEEDELSVELIVPVEPIAPRPRRTTPPPPPLNSNGQRPSSLPETLPGSPARAPSRPPPVPAAANA